MRNKKLLTAWFSTFVVGDLATTLLALSQFSYAIAESNSVVAGVIHSFGLWSLIPLKLGVFMGAYVIYRRMDHSYRVFIPVSLTVVGTVITLSNLLVLLKVV